MARDGKVQGTGLALDLEAEKKLQTAILDLARSGLLQSAHDISDGGLVTCLAESSIASGRGVAATAPAAPAGVTPWACLVSEEPSRVIVSASADKVDAVLARFAKHDVPAVKLGVVGGQAVQIEGIVTVDVAALRSAHEGALRPIVGD